jgi:hypothetical protein
MISSQIRSESPEIPGMPKANEIIPVRCAYPFGHPVGSDERCLADCIHFLIGNRFYDGLVELIFYLTLIIC